MTLRNIDLPSLRAAFWAHRALRHVHHDLKRRGLQYAPLPAPPDLPPHARRGVLAVLRRQPSTCLERALVLQRWQVAHGSARDVVIAVRGPTMDFSAHAWVDGEPSEDVSAYEELVRLGPR